MKLENFYNKNEIIAVHKFNSNPAALVILKNGFSAVCSFGNIGNDELKEFFKDKNDFITLNENFNNFLVLTKDYLKYFEEGLLRLEFFEKMCILKYIRNVLIFNLYYFNFDKNLLNLKELSSAVIYTLLNDNALSKEYIKSLNNKILVNVLSSEEKLLLEICNL